MSLLALLLIVLLLLNGVSFVNVFGVSNKVVVFNVLKNGFPVVLYWPAEEYPIANVGDRFVMEITMWNLKFSYGNSSMVYVNDTLVFRADLYGMVLEDPGSWVAGYPEIYYGVKPWNNVSAIGFGKLRLPAHVSDLPVIYVELSIELMHDKDLPINVAFDLWLTDRPGGPVNSNSIEVMIWLYDNNIHPAGEKTNFIVIDNVMNTRWEVWIRCNGKDKWTIVSYRSTKPLVNKSVALELNDFINKSIKYATTYCGISVSDNMYLNDIELGTEFGNPYVTKAVFEWRLKYFRIYIIQR